MCIEKFHSRPQGKIPLIHITSQEEYSVFRKFISDNISILKITFDSKQINENETLDTFRNVFDIEDFIIGVGKFEDTNWNDFPQYVFKPFKWFFEPFKKKFVGIEEK